MKNSISPTNPLVAFSAIAIFILFPCVATAQDAKTVIVNVDNFVRVETAKQFDRVLKVVGGVNKWLHIRQPTSLDQQTVIRMNRDTLYSSVLVDISKGATFTMPDSGDRYMSVMVINEDHYLNNVILDAGTYELTMEEFDTPYVALVARTLVNASDPDDIKEGNALQDQMKIESASARPYAHPDYDHDSYQATYNALIELGRGVSDTRRTFGKKEEVSEVRHLLATAWAWGGLPIYEAYYLNVEPNLPVGAHKITVKNVPVDAFWSISVYNKDGYFQKNEYDAYSVNNISSTPNADGSFTIHFGGDPTSVDHLPITEGWNYAVRLYEPRPEILDGSWTFPNVVPVSKSGSSMPMGEKMGMQEKEAGMKEEKMGMEKETGMEDKMEMKDKMGMEKTDSMTEKKHNKMDKDKM